MLWCSLLGGFSVRAQEPPPPDTQSATEEDLSKKLVRQVTSASDEDVMDRLLRLMDESARQLSIEFDPGTQTQAVQGRIIEQLDEAIKVAAAQRRKGGPARPQTHPDKRRRQDADQKQGEDAQADAAQEVTTTASPTAAGDEQSRHADQLREFRRAWGNLPERDREEIIQGSSEGFLERYRAWIERYYRALQEADEKE
ncbi:MAG TPA: hypothetical protein PKK06_07775 [Phycisphaerae bacterium]|nr:hypothetical protein [Phycisphaerae bacterium]